MTINQSRKTLESSDLPLHNEAALKELRKAKDFATGVAVTATTLAGATILVLLHPISLVLFALAYKPVLQVQKIARSEILTDRLLKEFKNEDIQVFPLLPIGNDNYIDLFIRFPRKTHLFVSIRSKGDTKIVYNETKEILQVRKKRNRGGLSTWLPCPLVELADYKTWLDKNRNLFGMSSREAQKTPTTRVLALWHPTKITNHNDHLYTEIGTMRILTVKKKGTAFVIYSDELIEFVKNWLDRYQ